MSNDNLTLGTQKQLNASEKTILKCLQTYAPVQHYNPDQHLIYEGDECEAAYVILEGTVRIYRNSLQGRQHTLIQLGRGQAFNTVPVFLAESKNTANALAMNPVTVIALYRNHIDHIIKLCPDLALFLIHDFADRLSHLSVLAGDLALHSVRARLARFLLDQIAGGENTLWTHEEIAAHIGTVREVVSRTMRDFIKQGWLRKDRQRLYIVDKQALQLESEK